MAYRRAILFILAILALTAPSVVVAQATVDDVLRCKTVADAGQRLACFDRLFNYVRAPAYAPPSAYPPAYPPAYSPAYSHGALAPAPSYAPATPYPYGAPPASYAPPAPAPQPTVMAAIDPDARIQIIKITKGPRREAMFHLRNGQLWQQMDTRRVTLRKGEYVMLRPTKAGKYYRLHTVGRSGYISVVRIR